MPRVCCLFTGGIALLLCTASRAGSAPPPPALVVEPLRGGVADFYARFTPAQLELLEKLNRRDLVHLARATRIQMPLVWDLDELAYSPLPATDEWASAYVKALVVDLAEQAFGGYEHGRLVRWGPISSGSKTNPTPSGLFHLNWRSRGRNSTVNPRWFMPWYFNFENRRGLSFHEYVLPGYPASHACIRLLRRDAQWLFDWGEEWRLDARTRMVLQPGTPVHIRGRYDHDAAPPWLSSPPPRDHEITP